MPDPYHPLQGQEPSSKNARLQEPNMASHCESRQAYTPFIRQGFWWLVTATFCAFILVTIRIFERKGNITNVQKHTFNTIITGLILGLGLNFFVCHHAHPLYAMYKGSSFGGFAGAFQVRRQSLSR